MADDRKWFHVTTHTYGAWLYGDPRGFRTRHHREHIEGDYRNPPPEGKYAAKYERSKESLKQEPVRLTPEWREVVGAALRERLVGLGAEVIAVAMTATHAHILAKMPNSKEATRDWLGLAKKHAWFLARSEVGRPTVGQAQQGHAHQGLRPSGEQLQLHPAPRQAGRRLGVDVSRPTTSTKPTLCKVWAWNSTYNGLHAATATTTE